ncbi:MAG: GGDEF domain-containing protein [candidate division Zixibacteria bacterium]|nr:GGDEF domain-containing protein [candidate division Zixibacteria bacterium]
MIPLEYVSTVLIGIITVLSIIILFLIIRLIAQNNIFKNIDIIEFSTFLRTNSLDGSIQVVASKVGDFLKESILCNKIIFLRKKRGSLELNYYYGINRFNRREFNVNFSKELDSRLRTDFLPKSIKNLQDVIPEQIFQRISDFGIDLYFPIFWRDNLYGIYFFKSKIKKQDQTFEFVIASFAQALSSAYHIKWHETKHVDLTDRIDKLVVRSDSENKLLKQSFTSILQLVKKRNPEKLLQEFLDILYNSLNLNKAALIYTSNKGEQSKVLIKGVDNKYLNLIGNHQISQLVTLVNKRGTFKIENLMARSTSKIELFKELSSLNLKYITHFPLGNGLHSFLAWSGEPFVRINRKLEFFKEYTGVLFENAQTFEKIEGLSFTDGLTKLSNQRYFMKRLYEEIDRCSRYKRKLGLVFFDLDALKKTNDMYGHLAGDDILSQVADILRKSIRAIDIVARYGGDEFCVIMPEADEGTCVKFMQRLQKEVTQSDFVAEGVKGYLNCTISMGAAVYPNHAEDAKKLIYFADMALLKAKEGGRDMFWLHQDQQAK